MKGIKDILADRAPEEKELHKDLIQECVDREVKVDKASKISAENFKKLTELSYEIKSGFDEILKTVDIISLPLTETDEKVH